MCVSIEIDVDIGMLKDLRAVTRTRLAQVCDRCSIELFDEGKVESIYDLNKLAGEAFINSMYVAAIEAAIEKDQEDKRE